MKRWIYSTSCMVWTLLVFWFGGHDFWQRDITTATAFMLASFGFVACWAYPAWEERK